jgi:hypothetical protein
MEKVVHPVYRVHRPRGCGGSPVHHGPGGGVSGTPHRSGARGWLWAWLLAARAPRGKGGRGEPHRGRRWAAREWSEAGHELQWWRLFALNDKMPRAGRDGGWSGFGRSGKWPSRSNRRWMWIFNAAAVSGFDSAPRGGNEGAGSGEEV